MQFFKVEGTKKNYYYMKIVEKNQFSDNETAP